jgi:hypothetical protein
MLWIFFDSNKWVIHYKYWWGRVPQLEYVFENLILNGQSNNRSETVSRPFTSWEGVFFGDRPRRHLTTQRERVSKFNSKLRIHRRTLWASKFYNTLTTQKFPCYSVSSLFFKLLNLIFYYIKLDLSLPYNCVPNVHSPLPLLNSKNLLSQDKTDHIQLNRLYYLSKNAEAGGVTEKYKH